MFSIIFGSKSCFQPNVTRFKVKCGVALQYNLESDGINPYV